MTPFVTAGAGFLLAVLWFDLMFDVQMLGGRGREPEASLTSIAAYYRRVTTTARPMNRLIAAVMLGTLVAIVVQLARGDSPGWVAGASLALAGAAMLVAALHTVPTAVRLGRPIGHLGHTAWNGAVDPSRPCALFHGSCRRTLPPTHLCPVMDAGARSAQTGCPQVRCPGAQEDR